MKDISLDGNTILMVFEDEISPYNASFGLAKELILKGNKVIYACSEQLSNHLKKYEFSYYVFNGKRTEEIELELKSFLSINKIDLVLIDPTLTHFAHLLLKNNLPIVGLSSNFGGVLNWNSPPVFSNLSPVKWLGFLNKPINIISWSTFYLKYHTVLTLLSIIHLIVKRYIPYNIKVIRYLKNMSIDTKWGEYGYRMNIPELKLLPRWLDFPSVSNWNEKYYIGALPYAANTTNTFNWDGIQVEKPVIYCSLGSHGQHYPKAKLFLELLLQVFAKNQQWELIIQIDSLPITTLLEQNKTENVHVFKWLPQKEILSRSSLFITHGGMGSIREALYYQVPMIVRPFHADQFGNAARLEYLNLGISLPTYSSFLVCESCIKKALDNGSIKQSLYKAKELLNQESPSKAVSLIEKLIISVKA